VAMKRVRNGWTAVIVSGVLFGATLVLMPLAAPLFAAAFPGIQPPVYEGESFPALWLSHAGLVVAATLVSALAAVGLGIFVTRPAGREFRVMANALATIGQSCPPVAVLAIAVPAVGYGPVPTFLALAVYGFLPILENTIAGIESVPPAVREAALGMGLSPVQVLRDVELPLAGPTILAGIRTAVVINIGTATIGSTVGAVTLGTPIIDGLVSDKLPYVVQGAIVVGLFAVFVDLLLDRCDRRLRSPGARTD
jgi:osmoprotectant transport system permease protein